MRDLCEDRSGEKVKQGRRGRWVGKGRRDGNEEEVRSRRSSEGMSVREEI